MPTLADPAVLSAPALAGAAQGGGGSGFSFVILALPILLIVFMIFSQRRRQKQMQDVQSSLQVGQEVMTTTGLHARISGIGDSVLYLEISPGTVVTWDRRGVVPRPGAATPATEPVDEDTPDHLPSQPPTTPPAGEQYPGVDEDPRSPGSSRGE